MVSVSSLLAEATGSGGLGVVPSILESYLSEATGILGTGLGGVTGTGMSNQRHNGENLLI